MRGRLHAAAAALALTLVALMVPASPGWAHDVLLDTGPRADATVGTVPEAVELTFNNVPLAIGSEVVVADADGVDRAEGDLTIVDTVVSQPIAADAPAGRYTVTWRVVSSDGHPISGTFAFTATEGAAPEDASEDDPSPTTAQPEGDAATAGPTGTADTGAEATGTDTTAEPTDAADATSAPAAGADDEADPAAPPVDDGSPVAMVVGLAVLALALSGLGYWLLRRRRVRPDVDAG